MWLPIDSRSSTPIYQQIIDGIKERIAKGVLEPQSKLPSIRELAMDLTINPNTIAKAYQELERGRVIEVVRGKGTFVCALTEAPQSVSQLPLLRESLKKLLVEAHHLNVPFSEVAQELENMIASWFEEKEGE